MAARKNRRTLDDTWRERISASMLANRLSQHVKGEVEMSATQIQAAKILLAKVIPDLKAVEHTGEGGGALEVVVSVKPHATPAGD